MDGNPNRVFIEVENIGLPDQDFDRLMSKQLVQTLEGEFETFELIRSEDTGRLECRFNPPREGNVEWLFHKVCYYAGNLLMNLRLWTDGMGPSRDKIIQIRQKGE